MNPLLTLLHRLLARTGSCPPARRGLPCNHRQPAIYRLIRDEGQARQQGELARDARLALVEAALMAADEPLTLRRLCVATGIAEATEVRRLVQYLQELYERGASAFQVEELAGGYQLLTRPQFHPWLARLRRWGGETRLSPAARETLAIIAYRQPITRADIEAIRGVQSSEILRLLMEKGMIRMAGRHDSLGRPTLYATTRKFLQTFGLKALKDLPPIGESGAEEKHSRKGPSQR